MIKTFGSTIRDLSFNRLPTVIQKAKAAIPDEDVVGFCYARCIDLRG
jgi:hypothetical protein